MVSRCHLRMGTGPSDPDYGPSLDNIDDEFELHVVMDVNGSPIYNPIPVDNWMLDLFLDPTKIQIRVGLVTF